MPQRRDRRADSRFELRNEINVTPLMDLTFLLLIVFMITAPMLQYSLDVSLPELNAEALEPKRTVVVSLTRSGTVFLDEREVRLEALTAELNGIADPEVSVTISADERRPYGEVMDLMKRIRRAGLEDIQLMTEAEQE